LNAQTYPSVTSTLDLLLLVYVRPLATHAKKNRDATSRDSDCKSNLDSPGVRMNDTVQIGSGEYSVQLGGSSCRDYGGIHARCGLAKLVYELVDKAGLCGREQERGANGATDCIIFSLEIILC
jgi:hypothetical protein